MWEETALIALIEGHRGRHPAMEVADVYKLLYQGVLGPEHLVASAEEFAGRLRAEYGAVPPEGDELLWETVRPDGELGRVNLRPFKALGGDINLLIDSCLRTAQRRWGTLEELQAVWSAFVGLCRAGQWEAFPPAEVLAFTAGLEEQGWPVVHHSVAYREANKPAYRVVHALTPAPEGAEG